MDSVQHPPTSPVPELTPNGPAHHLQCTTAALEHCVAALQASKVNPPKFSDQWRESTFHQTSPAYETPIDREAGPHCAAAFKAPLTRTATSQLHLNELMLSIPPSAVPFFERNGYIPEKILGQGVGGVVVQAFSLSEDAKVAIKVVDKKESLSLGPTSAPSNEVVSLKRAQGHPNIIGLYGVETTEDFLFILMELAEAGSLWNYIEMNDQLPERTCQYLFRGLISGVKHCHDNQVLHGDIHSHNLLLDRNGNLKLSDFGLARIVKDDQQTTDDGRAFDTWSTGAVLFHMVYGYAPFDFFDENELLQAEANDIRPGVSDGCKDLIRSIIRSQNPLTLSEIFHHPWTEE